MARPRIVPRSYTEFSLKSLFRRPDWRYTEAVDLAAEPPTRRKPYWAFDPPTEAAIDIHRARAGDRRAGRVDPALAAAEGVYRADGPARWLFEAYVMAGLTTPEAADRAGLPAAVAAAYEPVFFDFRPRKDGHDWVRYIVLRGAPTAPLPHGDIGMVWRLVGYDAGPVGLDLVVAATRDVCGDWAAVPGRVGRLLDVLWLPADVPVRRLIQLHLRLLAEKVGAGPAAYHMDRPGRSAKAGRKKPRRSGAGSAGDVRLQSPDDVDATARPGA